MRELAVNTSVISLLLLVNIAGCCGDHDENLRLTTVSPEVGNQPPQHHVSTVAEWERWTPRDFFESPNELRRSEAISSRSLARLQELLEAGAELNNPGHFGMTVLYWAFIEGQTDAFKLLLEHGADPDRRLTAYIPSKRYGKGYAFGFVKADTVMFTSVRRSRAVFCIAALKYSKNPDQRDLSGENLLHTVLSTGNGTDVVLQALIDAGVDMNAKGRFGCTPCRLGLYMTPDFVLKLLRAGADPSIRDDEGKDLADRLEAHLASNARLGQPNERFDPLVTWLSQHYREIQRPDQQPLRRTDD